MFVRSVIVPVPKVMVPEKFAAAAVIVPVNVGEPANTAAPVPVSSVSAAARFALDGVARNVATPVPSPLMPVATGRPVAFVSVTEVGVPRTGVVNVGDVVRANVPVPDVLVKVGTPEA